MNQREWYSIFESGCNDDIEQFLNDNPSFDVNQPLVIKTFVTCSNNWDPTVERVCDILLQRGLHVNHPKGLAGPLDIAIVHGSHRCTEYFLKRGALVSVSALFAAASQNRHDNLCKLLEIGKPHVRLVVETRQEMRDRAYVKEDSQRSLRILSGYIHRYLRRSNTCLVVLWAFVKRHRGVWRDVSSSIVRLILERPLTDFRLKK